MKLIKMLTPVILSGFLAFPAFAAEEQNAQAQAQLQTQAQDQQANATHNEQVAASDASANANSQSDDPKSATGGKKMSHKKCTKCKHKKVHAKGKSADNSMSGQTTSENQPQPAQELNQAQNPNQNS